MQRDGQLDRAQVGRQVAAGLRYRGNQELTQFAGQFHQLSPLQAAQCGGGVDAVEQGICHGVRKFRIADGR